MRCQSITPSLRIPIGLWRTAIHVSRTLTFASSSGWWWWCYYYAHISVFTHFSTRDPADHPRSPRAGNSCRVIFMQAVGKVWGAFEPFIYVHRCRQAMRCCRLFMVTLISVVPCTSDFSWTLSKRVLGESGPRAWSYDTCFFFDPWKVMEYVSTQMDGCKSRVQ